MGQPPGLLGVKPSRQFKIFRTEFPAIFRFNGKLYQEHYNIDTTEDSWVEISESDAERWTKAEPPAEQEYVAVAGSWRTLEDVAANARVMRDGEWVQASPHDIAAVILYRGGVERPQAPTDPGH